jgi:predicted nucleotidyltransferase
MKLIPLFECLIGSHAYGLATASSDVDIRSAVMPGDLSYYFGLKTFEQKVYASEDRVDWHIEKFCRLAAAGNTQMLEMLFSSQECIHYLDPEFAKLILDERHRFITKQVFPVIKGYSYSEYRKAIGESSRDLGAKRKEGLNKFGYSPRNASHCIRLLYAGSKALTCGYFPVKLPEATKQICMDLKTGICTLEQFKEHYELAINALEAAMTNSNIPEKFDYDWLDKQLIQLQINILRRNNLL